MVARTDAASLDAWAKRWAGTAGVTRVYPAEQVGSNLSTVDIDVTGDPEGSAALNLVDRVRADRPAGAQSWVTGDAALLRPAMDDQLHQPHRFARLRHSAELVRIAYEPGAAGACLSGAGPSVLAICDSPVVAHAVEKALNASGVAGMATRLRFDEAGARLTPTAAE